MAIKNKYSNIDLEKYNQGYQKSNDVLNAQRLKEQAEEAVRNHGAFNYSNQDAYQNAMDAILNRKEFSYDLNGDALYQQYKNMYSALGKQAMTDTMGKAAALTGGYGNSYAATAGNQAYLGYMQQLGAMVPELYNLALSAYNAEGDRLNNNFNLLSTDRNTQYGEWSDRYNQLVNDRGYYGDNYNNAYSQDYNIWSDNRDYDTSQYWNEYNAGYQADRDAIADAQWQKQFDESVRQYNEQMAFNRAQANKSSSGGGGGGKGDGGVDDINSLSANAKKDIYKTLDKYRGRKDANSQIGANYEIAEKLAYFQKVYGLDDDTVDALYQEYSYDVPLPTHASQVEIDRNEAYKRRQTNGRNR